ncbi:polyhydroxyalkanoate synthesis repressor PhaR [Amphibiibacter pelophylacis]|uniref:Polyhydroxyalkanoate synthesis repressor PhaR n=1 Tax=Amphibiibacter pelophylacis TaxID=1799477 RepID=A0ACC6P2F9_9BURK
MQSSPSSSAPTAAVRVLKKYPNRRLYDSHSSSYVTLADVKAMVVAGTPFRVVDAKTAEDLTRSILLQIILEEETAGAPIFSETMLRVLIRVYGQAMHSSLGAWLEQSLAGVSRLQDSLGAQWQAQLEQLGQLPGAQPFAGIPPPLPGVMPGVMPAVLPGVLPGVGALPGSDWMQQMTAQWQAQQDQLRQAGEQFFASFQPPATSEPAASGSDAPPSGDPAEAPVTPKPRRRKPAAG